MGNAFQRCSCNSDGQDVDPLQVCRTSEKLHLPPVRVETQQDAVEEKEEREEGEKKEEVAVVVNDLKDTNTDCTQAKDQQVSVETEVVAQSDVVEKGQLKESFQALATEAAPPVSIVVGGSNKVMKRTESALDPIPETDSSGKDSVEDELSVTNSELSEPSPKKVSSFRKYRKKMSITKIVRQLSFSKKKQNKDKNDDAKLDDQLLDNQLVLS